MDDERSQTRRFLAATAIAFVVVFVTRALAFPHSWWLSVEPLLGMAMDRLDPAAGIPPAPGFPLYLDLAGALLFKAKTPFVALVVAAFLSGVGATIVLSSALRGVMRDGVGGALASLLLFMTPAMTVFSSTPAPEASALLFFALAVLGCTSLLTAGPSPWKAALLLGAGVAGTAGCQPEWALPAGLLLVAPLLVASSRRFVAVGTLIAAAGIAFVFAPLARALGGAGALVRWIVGGTAPAGESAAGALLDGLGPLWLSLPVIVAAVAGCVAAFRERERLLLVVIVPALANLVLVAVRGSVREPVLAILPALVAVAVLALRGLRELGVRSGQAWIRIALVAAYCLSSWIWVAPLLRARLNAAPPPSKAAIWIDEHVEPGSVVLVSRELMPHARALIPKARLAPLESSSAERTSALYALVPGETSQAGAIVFSWPDSAPLRQLARSRHRVVSVVPLRAPAPPP